MLKCRLAEQLESSGQGENNSHRTVVINVLFSMVYRYVLYILYIWKWIHKSQLIYKFYKIFKLHF